MSSRTGPEDTKKPFVDNYFECAENGNKEELSFLLKCKKFTYFHLCICIYVLVFMYLFIQNYFKFK